VFGRLIGAHPKDAESFGSSQLHHVIGRKYLFVAGRRIVLPVKEEDVFVAQQGGVGDLDAVLVEGGEGGDGFHLMKFDGEINQLWEFVGADGNPP